MSGRTPRRAAVAVAPAAAAAPLPALVAFPAGAAPVVFLDANILLPQYLRSVFLDLAEVGLVQAHWSQDVLDDVRRNAVRAPFSLPVPKADRLLQLLATSFPQALVGGYAPLQRQFAGKTDAKDEHVAAGALQLSHQLPAGRAAVLVTMNTKHLPGKAFAGTSVLVMRPSPFLTELLRKRPAVADVLAAMLSRFKQPPVRKQDLLEILDKSNCSGFATALATAWGYSSVAP